MGLDLGARQTGIDVRVSALDLSSQSIRRCFGRSSGCLLVGLDLDLFSARFQIGSNADAIPLGAY